MPANKIKKLYTVPEVARKISISEFTLRRWIKDGEIRSIKAGRRYYLTLEALDAFVDGEKVAK